jgi:signal transduction histidine kinase
MLSDRFDLCPKMFTTQSLLKEITDFYNLDLFRNIDLSFELLPNLPAAVIADKGRIIQVITTLLELIADNSDSKKIKMTISGLEDPNSKSREVGIHFVLRDEKCFIPSKFTKVVIDNLFNDKNLMLSDYTDREIALVLSSKLVDIMGGDIVINSSIDNGTTISIKVIKMQVVPSDIGLDSI